MRQSVYRSFFCVLQRPLSFIMRYIPNLALILIILAGKKPMKTIYVYTGKKYMRHKSIETIQRKKFAAAE